MRGPARASARADHEHRTSGVRSYTFGGGGSGAVPTEPSIVSDCVGIRLAGIGAEARSVTLATVVMPQLDIDSQQRSCTGARWSLPWRVASECSRAMDGAEAR